MKLIFSRTALIELEQIGDYIAEDSPRRALSFTLELRKAAKAITDAPRGYPLVPGFESRGIRRRPYGNSAIYYTMNADAVVILHFLHAARDHDGLI